MERLDLGICDNFCYRYDDATKKYFSLTLLEEAGKESRIRVQE